MGKRGFDPAIGDAVLAESARPRVKAAANEVIPQAPPPETAMDARIGFIGPWNYDNGLGVASRGYVSAFMNSGLAVNFIPFLKPFAHHRQVSPAVTVHNFAGAPDVVIVHANPDGWDGLLTRGDRAMISHARLRIGLFVWESQVLPPSFQEHGSEVNAIWAPSHFCADIFRAAFGVPVDVIPHPVMVPKSQPNPKLLAALRDELGITGGERVVLYAFDASSYLVRKNPQALVSAFAMSGLAADGWRLVLKTKALDSGAADARDLLKRIAACPGALVVDRSMPPEEMAALMQLADIYASPHASEGFGLTIAEAMAREKVVIATDFGGSRDFLDASVGMPVRAAPWRLESTHGAYQSGTVFGRVDEAHFAECLRQAAAMPEDARRELGRRARARIETLLAPEVIARQMSASLDRLLALDAREQNGRFAA
jgi:glycosyltransferase involved in cell wall biosynthesis